MISLNVAVNAKNVSLKLNNKYIVSNLSFKIPKGSITLIKGDNGIGKSVTLKLIAQLIRPTKGKIQTNGRIAYAPDKFPNNLKIKVHTFLETIQNLNNNYDHNWKYYSKSFNLSSFEKDKLNQISKGTLQKINIIQALLSNGEILIFDEPFNGLDKKTESNFISLLKKLSKTKTIILTSHESNIVQSFATHELNLHNGKFKTINTNPKFKAITFSTSKNASINFPQVLVQKIHNQININNNSIKIYIDRNDTNIILNNLIKHNYKILEVKDE